MEPSFADQAVFSAQDVSFKYSPDRSLFQDFSWDVLEGESWSVVGPSGCGKTTLLYLLAGLHRPYSGAIYFRGKPVVSPRREVGLMLQDYGLLPWLTAQRNIEVGLEIGGVSKHERKRISQEWLDRLSIGDVANHFVRQLSGGQRQRVALARVLALQPAVLLLDEPFSSVDEITRERQQKMLWELREELRFTLVLVTHNVEEAALLGRRILILPRSRPIRRGTVVAHECDKMASRTDQNLLACCAKLRKELEQCA